VKALDSHSYTYDALNGLTSDTNAGWQVFISSNRMPALDALSVVIDGAPR
jgi:hypothetical protein